VLRASTHRYSGGDDYLLQSITPDTEIFPQPQFASHSEHCLIYDDH